METISTVVWFGGFLVGLWVMSLARAGISGVDPLAGVRTLWNQGSPIDWTAVALRVAGIGLLLWVGWQIGWGVSPTPSQLARHMALLALSVGAGAMCWIIAISRQRGQ